MKNYRWEQCYELGDSKLWAIVDDDSAASRCVSSHLLVVNHEWADSMGRPFPKCDMPQRIIALLNGDTTYCRSSINAMRRYQGPDNGKPYSKEGLRDLQRQCLDAAKAGDSSLLEMAGLAIKRLLDDSSEFYLSEDESPENEKLIEVHKDRRFTRATYVVEHDHVIEYSGQSFLLARQALCGNQRAIVWMDGKWMGEVDYDGKWTFKTGHNPIKS